MKHVIDPLDLTVEEIDGIFEPNRPHVGKVSARLAR